MDNKRAKRELRSATRSRQSFGERVCDDLCEVVLNYLSFEDKIKYESVSKQFQRCVFAKQNHFMVDYSAEEKSKEFEVFYSYNNLNKLVTDLRPDLKRRCFCCSERHFAIKLRAFESVLKKCRNINHIYITHLFSHHFNDEEVMQSIIKCCRNLKSITFNFNDLKMKTITQFGHKFGQNLRFIHFKSFNKKNYNKYRRLLTFCPNITSFKGLPIDLKLIIDDKNHLLVPKLSTFLINLEIEDTELFKTFVKDCRHSLKRFYFSFSENMNEKTMTEMMKQTSLLNNLIDIKINLYFKGLLNHSFAQNLKLIGIECKQLKRLRFKVYFKHEDNGRIAFQIFNAMNNFKQLKYLKLSLFDSEKLNDCPQIRCHLLKDCKQLTHLKLYYPEMNDSFLENIDIYLPQLTHLEISLDNPSDQTLKLVSKLTNLQFIHIVSNADILETSDLITDVGVSHIINSCQEIRSINFYRKPNLTHKSIEALIELAERKPKTKYIHHLDDINDEMEDDYYGYDSEDESYPIVIGGHRYDSFPVNLKIIPNIIYSYSHFFWNI